MLKTILLYAAVMAGAAFGLQWLEYRYAMQVFSTEVYIVLIAAGFTALGIWVGHYLTRKSTQQQFTKNTAGLSSLGVSPREYEVLELLSSGHSNKEIARKLGVSPNTIKTHIARLYDKLDVQRRTQAIHKAKTLALIP
jgi:DNA-binding CsgD family transcriptional regulator